MKTSLPVAETCRFQTRRKGFCQKRFMSNLIIRVISYFGKYYSNYLHFPSRPAADSRSFDSPTRFGV